MTESRVSCRVCSVLHDPNKLCEGCSSKFNLLGRAWVHTALDAKNPDGTLVNPHAPWLRQYINQLEQANKTNEVRIKAARKALRKGKVA